MDARRQVPKEPQKGFDSAIILVSWWPWKERNSRVFNNVAYTTAQATRKVMEEGVEWIAVGFMALSLFMVAEMVP